LDAIPAETVTVLSDGGTEVCSWHMSGMCGSAQNGPLLMGKRTCLAACGVTVSSAVTAPQSWQPLRSNQRTLGAGSGNAMLARPSGGLRRSGYPKLSNNIIQKGLAFGRDWSATVVNSGRQGRSEIFAPPA
jgi:hypothetical protein